MGLTNDYRHTIYFNSLAEQRSYFSTRVAKTFTDYTYLRKNWSIKVVAKYETAESWSYLYFRNKDDGKYYYYFITEVKYLSDETVELVLEMDVMQTYMFDYNLSPCFVDREHSVTDYLWDNTIDEGLELGNYVNNSVVEDENLKNNNMVLILSGVDLKSGTFDTLTSGVVLGNVYSGLKVYAVHLTSIEKLIYDLGAKIDGIVSMWTFPEKLIGYKSTDTSPFEVTGGRSYEFTVNRPTVLDGYIPKNNKLYAYPYSYLYVSNNLGSSAIYRWERFLDGANKFEVEGAPLPDGGAKLVPKNYNGSGYNHEEGLVLTGFPTVPFNADTYKIWLAQNQNQRTLTNITSVGSQAIGLGMVAAGLATMNPMLAMGGGGMILSGSTNIASQIAQQKDMEKYPPQSRGSLSATINSVIDQFTFSYYTKSITAERAKIIDEYFTMYGYKTQRVKVPNRNVRKKFTYTKTVGCHITGNLCASDIVKIQSIYDNGITFWSKQSTVGDYTGDNGILGEG